MLNKTLIIGLSILSLPVLSSVDHLVGKDKRLRHNEVKTRWLKESGLAVAMMFLDDTSDTHAADPITLNSDGSFLVTKGKTLSEIVKENHKNELCKKTKFKNLLSFADCSGFLIGPNKLMTAGHCISALVANADEENYPLIKNVPIPKGKIVMRAYFTLGDNIEKSSPLRAKSMYTMTKIIEAALTPTLDYAIIELDREVEGITPLKVATDFVPELNDKVTIIGHPMGLPLIYSPGGKIGVTDEFKDGYRFASSSSVFGGNSGGPVISNRTKEVVGILVTAKYGKEISRENFVKKDEDNACMTYNQITDSELAREHAGSINISNLKAYNTDLKKQIYDAIMVGHITTIPGISGSISLEEVLPLNDIDAINKKEDLILLALQAFIISNQTRTLEYILPHVTSISEAAFELSFKSLYYNMNPNALFILKEYFPERYVAPNAVSKIRTL